MTDQTPTPPVEQLLQSQEARAFLAKRYPYCNRAEDVLRGDYDSHWEMQEIAAFERATLASAAGEVEMRWRPITDLVDIYQQPLWIASPELVDGDSNPLGIADGYWQDTTGSEEGEWRTTSFDMCNEEWNTITLPKEAVTHFLVPTGPLAQVASAKEWFTRAFYAEKLVIELREVLQKIATGAIKGEPNNHRDTLAVVREIATAALRDSEDERPDVDATLSAHSVEAGEGGALREAASAIADLIIDEGGCPRFTVLRGDDFDRAALRLTAALSTSAVEGEDE